MAGEKRNSLLLNKVSCCLEAETKCFQKMKTRLKSMSPLSFPRGGRVEPERLRSLSKLHAGLGCDTQLLEPEHWHITSLGLSNVVWVRVQTCKVVSAVPGSKKSDVTLVVNPLHSFSLPINKCNYLSYLVTNLSKQYPKQTLWTDAHKTRSYWITTCAAKQIQNSLSDGFFK